MKTASLGLLEVLVVRVNAGGEWYVFVVGCFGGVSYVTQGLLECDCGLVMIVLTISWKKIFK